MHPTFVPLVKNHHRSMARKPKEGNKKRTVSGKKNTKGKSIGTKTHSVAKN